MRRINHVEPISTNTDELTHGKMTTTTQIEIVRRAEVTPIVSKSIVQLIIKVKKRKHQT